MAEPASNNNNNLDGSQHKLQCNQTDLFPFPGFSTNNKTDVEDYTPVTKIPSSKSAKSTEESSSSATTKTPPVEPSVSPEIQSSFFPSVLVSGAAPSTCYGAGHVISGVNDRRKCKAKGILSAGRSKPHEHHIFEKSSSPSLMIPFPTEASISWNDDVVLKGDYSKRLSSVSPSDTVLHTPQEERILSLDFNGECSPFSVDFLSSGNVMQTPNSDSSLEGIQLKYKFESELEHESSSPKDNLSPWDPPRLSYEFADLTPLSNSTLENVSESQMRVSWRDDVMNGSFDEKDDLDCCRLLSDEEIDADGLLKPPKFFEGKEKETSFHTRINPCEESICTDDGGLTASADSDWTLHYKNQSFVL